MFVKNTKFSPVTVLFLFALLTFTSVVSANLTSEGIEPRKLALNSAPATVSTNQKLRHGAVVTTTENFEERGGKMTTIGEEVASLIETPNEKHTIVTIYHPNGAATVKAAYIPAVRQSPSTSDVSKLTEETEPMKSGNIIVDTAKKNYVISRTYDDPNANEAAKALHRQFSELYASGMTLGEFEQLFPKRDPLDENADAVVRAYDKFLSKRPMAEYVSIKN